MRAYRIPTLLLLAVLSLLAATASADTPQFWSNLVKVGSGYSDGVNPIQVTVTGQYMTAAQLGASGSAAVPTGIKGPGMLIYPAGAVPPFANSHPAAHPPTANSASDWNSACTSAVAGPYWPSAFVPTPSGGQLSATGSVSLKLLPAGAYDLWTDFGLASPSAPAGSAGMVYPAIQVTNLVANGNQGAATTPTVTLTVPDDMAVEGSTNTGKLKVVRVGGDTSQPLTVLLKAGVSANPLGATVFPGTDYTLAYATPGGGVGSTVSVDGTGNFSVVIPANTLAVRVRVIATAEAPHTPTTRPAKFKIKASSSYNIDSGN